MTSMAGTSEDDLRRGRPLEQVFHELQTSGYIKNANCLVDILHAEEFDYEMDLRYLDDPAIQMLRTDHGLSAKSASILRELRRNEELRSAQLFQPNDVPDVTSEQTSMDNFNSFCLSDPYSVGNFQSPDNSSVNLAPALAESQFLPSPGFIHGGMPSAESPQASFTWLGERQQQQQQQQPYQPQQLLQQQPVTFSGRCPVTDSMGPPTINLLEGPNIFPSDPQLTNDLNGNDRRVSAYFHSDLIMLPPPPWDTCPGPGIYRCDFGILRPSPASSRVYSWRKNGGTVGTAFVLNSVQYTCIHYHGKIVKSKRASKRIPYGSESEEDEHSANYAVGTLIKASTSQTAEGVIEISYRAEPPSRGSKRKDSESESDSDRFKKPKPESWQMPATGMQIVQMNLLPEEYMSRANSMPTVKVKEEPVQPIGLTQLMKQLETVNLTPPSSISTAATSELKKKPIFIGQVVAPSSSASSIASTVPMGIAESASVAASDVTRQHAPSVLSRQLSTQMNRQVDRPSQFIESPYIRPRGEHVKCTACNVLLQGAQAVAEHKVSLGHKLKLDPESVVDSIQYTAFDCVLCSTRISGMDQVRQHLEGAKHKKKVMQEKTL